MRVRPLVALIAAAIALVPAANAATPRERKLAARIDRLERKLDAKNELLAQVQAENARLWSDNAKLRDGLPNAILAVPIGDFWRLVFTPSRQAWKCDSLYSGSGYWALTFESSC